MRNRVKIFDAGFLILLLAAATLFAFEVDVFQNAPSVPRQDETLELDEIFVLTTMLMASILIYAWRRAREHRHENALRMAAEQEILKLAMQDPLTGLPNRRQFDAALAAAFTVAPREPEAHAVLLIDLNGFKKINDGYGHPIGDQALINVGSRIMRAVRDHDLVARFGGDEFAVLARNVAGPEGAATIARRIVESFEDPLPAGGANHPIGAGVGVALTGPEVTDPAELVRRADVALYRAKAERRSNIRFFEPAMDAQLRERDEMERALRDAIEADALVVRFLPIARVGTGAIAGFEAVPRWLRDTHGELGPERFIPIAEEIGLGRELVLQLMRKAFSAAASWPAGVKLSFNLPGGLLHDGTLGLRILHLLGETGLAPGRLDLEIDEGALMRDAEVAMTLARPLREVGVSLVAAHFGTGYSNLKNLHKLQLDQIKIDRSYIGAMRNDRQAAVMVRALIGIAQGLDLTVVADGVGSADQLAYLAQQGCQSAQGALYGEAVTAEETIGLIDGSPTVQGDFPGRRLRR